MTSLLILSHSYSGVPRKIVDQLRQRRNEESTLTGIFGFVADNFQCDENLYTAISATVGRQLLYLVVRDPSVANDIFRLLKNRFVKVNKFFIGGIKIYLRAPCC